MHLEIAENSLRTRRSIHNGERLSEQRLALETCVVPGKEEQTSTANPAESFDSK